MTTCTAPLPLLAVTAAQLSLSEDVLAGVPKDDLQGPPFVSELLPKTHKSDKQLAHLPVEIQESILDHLFGVRGSTASSASDSSPALRGWSNVLRHPRRRQLSNLALVSQTWRQLIQERLYRHVKIKGTRLELNQCAKWFFLHLHLKSYVRHVEVWVPVWEKKAGTPPSYSAAQLSTQRIQTRTIITTVVNATTTSFEETNNISLVYQLASHNATLEEIFQTVQNLFPEACILTLEGGHCKKPPMIQHFRAQSHILPHLPVIESVRTLVLKGAWNIMRDPSHFHTIATSFPNVREWHCTYAKPKSKGYLTIARVLPNIPHTLTHINLSLEGFYCKEAASPNMWRKIYPQTHICLELAKIAPQLEALTYTGRICASFFSHACRTAEQMRPGSKLKTLDLVVKNCCRPKSVFNDGTGITNLAFIKSFEALVTSGVRSLGTLVDLTSLRIRFIDLDSTCPLLNPYFQLKDQKCTGLWNEEILTVLTEHRPATAYVELADGLSTAGLDKDGHLIEATFPRRRPLSIKASSYAQIADVGQL
ncbi:MAG: hypothetical protein M1827_007196 [Pycnora praestabilis]|nr:MAG: hypothetical protein M1827_007196 [Pycnora praestabilis]